MLHYTLSRNERKKTDLESTESMWAAIEKGIGKVI